ncbi:hypothetical protein A2U01_0058310 [Trifolium medium]|uniref:Uncharacterized protein n=1 Tax=Trifolium medium TaxID=97028 RepID=A0A392RNG7_9FABA|nr:hypothetical protein [Trifolium medium]
MSSGDSVNSGTGTGGARFDFNYNASTFASTSSFDKSDMAPFFNGDSTLFSF